ncbi:hypothetical protein [Endozoicomonas numazuensis]|uniref:Uncharacterized protein n=1 Tax=Endozoicomonas numazuensis TaxID=1137799 RepID=A0A081NJT7_9GAMM|nr:hypothetical protein [Endozoicomonas numazuensis]KEQ18710.1 hypothetical protein GZ78_00915 [Endozoicomonas numazuensis]
MDFHDALKSSAAKCYVHIELGAGNPVFRYGDRYKSDYSPAINQKDIHSRECSCEYCDYSENTDRFKILTLTLDNILKNRKEEDNLIIYLNDLDLTALDQAVKHLKKHITMNYKDIEKEIQIKSLPGNYFDLNLESLNPDSVHLKNPETTFFYKIEKNFTATIGKLMDGCYNCQDRGLVLIVPRTVCRNDNFEKLFSDASNNSAGATLEKFFLPFDVRYRFPRWKGDRSESEYTSYLCKPPNKKFQQTAFGSC